MKKTFAVLLIMIMLISVLTACGGTDAVSSPIPQTTPTPTPTPESTITPTPMLDTESEPTPAPEQTQASYASDNWRQLYFDEIRTALNYAADNVNKRFPTDYPVSGCIYVLADLNFDGIPELLMYGDGASEVFAMWIFTIVENKVERIGFDQWDFPSTPWNIWLYSNVSDDSLAYIITSGGGEGGEYWWSYHLTNQSTILSDRFLDDTMIAESTVWENWEDFDAGSDENVTYTFNGETVSEEQWSYFRENPIDNYIRLDFVPATLDYYWSDGWPTHISDSDIFGFLDSYVSERQW